MDPLLGNASHYILSEFEHFYLVKLFNPLMNEDYLLWTMNCFTSNFVSLVTLFH